MSLNADSLRIGIVGAGYIAGVHSAAYRCVPGTFPEGPRQLPLTAVADADEQRAAALQRRWGWQRLERDWKAITRAEDIDVVDVCVPNHLHAEIAIDALAHGKHVICEKPLAHDLAGAREMCRAASEASGLAQVCFYYRLWPAIAWARELVHSGELGAIQHFRGWMLQDYAADPSHAMGWRTTRASAGAGALGDLGSHVTDIARSLCGEVKAVSAITRQLVARPQQTELDDAAVMLLELQSGASGVIEASWAMRGHKCDLGFDLIGERGAVRFSWERSNEIEVLLGDPDDQANGFRRVLVGGELQPGADRFAGVPGQGVGYRDAFTLGLGQALCAISANASEVSPSFEDGLRVAEVAAAALRSAETREWTAVDAL